MCVITNKQHCTACDWITDLPRSIAPCARLLELAAARPDVYRAGPTGHGLRDTCPDVSYAIASTGRDEHCVHEELRERHRLERIERERMKGAQRVARRDARAGTGAGAAGGLFRMGTKKRRGSGASVGAGGGGGGGGGIGAWAARFGRGREEREEGFEEPEEV